MPVFARKARGEAGSVAESGQARNGESDPAPLMQRVFYACLGLAALSAVLSLAGKWTSATMAAAGHTTSTRPYEIVIGNSVLSVPANAIRFERARADGTARRLDLYLRWPELEGYSRARRDDFNHVEGSKRIVFLTFAERAMSRDMSGRFEPVYRGLIETRGQDGPGGVRFHVFKKDTGYDGEVLAVARNGRDAPFVARCLTGPAATQSLAPCERDVAIGEELSVTYRFPAALLAQWRRLDAAMKEKARAYLRTAG